MQNSRYALLGFAAVIVAGGVAAYYGMIPLKNTASDPMSKPVSEQGNPKTEPGVVVGAPISAAPAVPVPSGTGSSVVLEPAVGQSVTVPEFDVLRLEGGGSLVVAGKASSNAMVDVISKTSVLGSAKAGSNGDFAIVIEKALNPGDYQLVLRATSEDKSVATSQQTAILSVPETPEGQVLALVEEPGQASRMITMPEAGGQTIAPVVPLQTGNAVINPAPATVQPDSTIYISVEAVEIEGQSVFIAGQARGGQSVNISANDNLLGSSLITAEGRYLVQSQQPLAVGDYIIRADLLDKAGKVLTTARVPFRREAGDNIAAVAPNNLNTSAQAPDQSIGGNTGQPLEKAQGSVIIRKGDNLWTISKRTYGNGMRYTTIYLANSDQIKNPDLIWPGQVFVMPQTPLSDEAVKLKRP